MKIRSLVALAGLTISTALPTFAQQANDLVGAWTLVSITLEKDGTKTDFYGPNPQGQLMYDANGRFCVIITRSDLPKFASNNRETGTAEENKAIVQGSLAYFGTYTVSETDKTITTHIESSTFPNWNGADRKTSFNISGDELSVQVVSGPLTTVGTGTASLVWKRAK
jgi:Lipocalin-like domain